MECYLGMIMTFAYNWAPYGFAACNGQTMPIQQNSALFALLGVNFGGNGTSTFGIPDLRGRAPVHFGQVHYNGGAVGSTYEFAQQFGLESETLTTANVPLLTHTHTIGEKTANGTVTVTATAPATTNASTAQGTAPNPTGNYWAKVNNSGTLLPAYSTPKNATMASDAVTVTVTPTTTFTVSNLAIGASGAAATSPFALAQPSLALNFCICTAGLFPSRN